MLNLWMDLNWGFFSTDGRWLHSGGSWCGGERERSEESARCCGRESYLLFLTNGVCKVRANSTQQICCSNYKKSLRMVLWCRHLFTASKPISRQNLSNSSSTCWQVSETRPTSRWRRYRTNVSSMHGPSTIYSWCWSSSNKVGNPRSSQVISAITRIPNVYHYKSSVVDIVCITSISLLQKRMLSFLWRWKRTRRKSSPSGNRSTPCNQSSV